MAFSGYLSPGDVDRLVIIAVESGLIEFSRPLLLQNIPRPFANSLTRANDDVTQFNLDLVTINQTERLADGQAPIVRYLRNCAFQLRLRSLPQADEFEHAANRVGNRVAGVPALPNVAALPEIVRQEAIVGVNDMVHFRFLAAGAVAGRSVACLRVPRFEAGVQVKSANGMPWLMNGTGWMIGPGLMLTNHHVINARLPEQEPAGTADFALQGKNTVAEFDFDGNGAAVTRAAMAEVVLAEADLDYALLRLADPQPDRRPALRIHPQKVVFTAASYVPLNVIQHPNGEEKRVALRNNLLTGADSDTLRYFTDTDLGSSGSPVLDDTWQVVALHRGAQFVRERVNFQGHQTAFVNFGSQIQAILQRIKDQFPLVHEAIAGS